MKPYKRGKVWYIDYSLNGRRVRKSLKTESRHTAALIAKDIDVKIAKQEFLGITTQRQILFDDLCADYLRFSKSYKTASSYRRDETSVKNLLRRFRGIVISKITAYELERYVESRRDEVAHATVNRELSCIKHMFTKAVHWQLLKDNPLRPVKKLREPAGRLRYLTETEIENLLYCCPTHIKPVVTCALNTGMRLGEILRLQWQDVDMVKRQLTVRESKNHESRNIPINDSLYVTLIRLPDNPERNGHVFLGKHGKPIRSIQNAWERALKRAKINDFRFHDLRHTFATNLTSQGVTLRTIQGLLGQKTILMTMRYSHLTDKTLRDAVDKVSFAYYNDCDSGTNLAQVKASGE